MDSTLQRITTTQRDRQVSCPLCRQSASQAHYRYDYGEQTAEILQCASCNHLFLALVLLPEPKDRAMNTTSDAELFGSSLMRMLHRRLVLGREIRHVRRINPQAKTLLDIGCGTGWTTAIWKEEGFEVTGLELSPERARVAKEKYGIPVLQLPVEELPKDRTYNVIIIRHLLEHIENPVTFMKNVQGILSPNGLVIVVVPNINCIGRYIFRENWEWVLPWHLHFFRPRTLTKFMEDLGFSKLTFYQTPSPLWYPHTLDKALFGSSGRKLPRFLGIFISLLIVMLGVLINCNDNMTLVLEKSET